MNLRQSVERGLAAAGLLAVGGIAWRALESGVLGVGRGEAYEPWEDIRRAHGVKALVQAGVLAASPHNTQPWRFALNADTIIVSADLCHNLGSFDPFRREMHLSLGCALENIVQAAYAEGLAPYVDLIPGRLTANPSQAGTSVVAVVDLSQGTAQRTGLFAAIPQRHTHRGAYLSDRPIPQEVLNNMQAQVPVGQSLRLFLFTDGDRGRLAELIIGATRAIVADRAMAADSARWFRFDQNAIESHRDGLTLDTMVHPPLKNAAAKLLSVPSDQEANRQWIDDTRDVHVATAPLLGMIAVQDLYDVPTALVAGRLWQRLHLLLTALGLAAQPLNQPAEMVDREAELAAPPRTAEALASITGDPAWHPTFIFRAGYASRPGRLSPRRPIEAALDA